MDKVYYYYERDRESRPIITKCILVKGGEIALGVAVCSEKDQPNKVAGRKIAYGRAKYALNVKKNVLPIETDRVHNVQANTSRGVFEDWKGLYFGTTTSNLTIFEKRLLRIEPNIK